MISATGIFDGSEATVTEDGWASDDKALAADLNRGWPVRGGEAGHPVLLAFYSAIKALRGKIVRADECPPMPDPGAKEKPASLALDDPVPPPPIVPPSIASASIRRKILALSKKGSPPPSS